MAAIQSRTQSAGLCPTLTTAHVGGILPRRFFAVIPVTVVLCLWLLGSTLVHAGGFHITFIGSRRNGMIASLAKPDDLSAIYHNPSALADMPGVRVQLFGSTSFLSCTFDLEALDPTRYPEINPSGCGEEGGEPCPWPIGEDGRYTRLIKPEETLGILPFLGVSTDLTFIDDDWDNVVISAAVYAPNFYGAWLPEDAPSAYSVTKTMFVVIATTVGFGWRINDIVAIGGTISYNYMRTLMAQKMSVVDALTPEDEDPNPIAVGAQRALGDLVLDYDGVDHGVGWTASLLVNPLDWLAIAIVYSGASAARFEGSLAIDAPASPSGEELNQLIDLMGYKLPHELEVHMPIPPALSLGLNVVPTSWMEIGVDFRLWFYSQYKRQKVVPRYDESSPGEEPFTEDSLSSDKNYHDSWEVALGLLLRPFGDELKLEIMTGIGFDRSPVPDETFSLESPSSDMLKMGVGVRWWPDDQWRVSITYACVYAFEREVSHSQTHPPTNGHATSINHSPGLEVEVIF